MVCNIILTQSEEESKGQNRGQQAIIDLDLSSPKSFHRKKSNQKNIPTKKNSDPKNFRPKKISDQKIFQPKFFSDQNNFSENNFFLTKNFPN